MVWHSPCRPKKIKDARIPYKDLHNITAIFNYKCIYIIFYLISKILELAKDGFTFRCENRCDEQKKVSSIRIPYEIDILEIFIKW